MEKRVSVKEKLVFFLIVFYMLQDPLGQVIGIINYFDEVLVLVGAVVLLIEGIKHFHEDVYWEKWLIRILICFLLLIVIGICGNIAWGYQKKFYITLDIVAFMKFFVGLFLGYLFSINQCSRECKKWLVVLCKVVVWVQFVLTLHEQFFTPWFEYLDGFGSIKAVKLYYTTQTYLSAYSVFCMAVFLLLSEKSKERICYVIMAALPIMLTMRSKAWGFLILFFVIAIVSKKVVFQTPIWVGGMAMPLVIIVAWDKIKLYFVDSNHYSPRLIILQDGLALAQEYFPIGTGFGTFCSVGAAVGGSPVYSMLGMDYTSEYIAKSINDMYWGYLLGQFGLLGMIAMLTIIFEMVMVTWKLQVQDRSRFLAGMCLVSYILIASIGESPFFASYIIGFAFLLGGILKHTDNERV